MQCKWLRAVEADLKPLNTGLSSAWKKATSRENWWSVVDTATLKKSMSWEEEEEKEKEKRKRRRHKYLAPPCDIKRWNSWHATKRLALTVSVYISRLLLRSWVNDSPCVFHVCKTVINGPCEVMYWFALRANEIHDKKLSFRRKTARCFWYSGKCF